MRKFIIISALSVSLLSVANTSDSTLIKLDEIVVSTFYSSSIVSSNVINQNKISSINYGQEPSNYFAKMPSIYSTNDNGTEFGYGYFRIRGLDQTRINVTLDGCPWNEAEDYGAYFANSPDLMSSMRSITLDKGTSSNSNGIAGVAGGINLESVNVFDNNQSYLYVGGGSFNTLKTSFVYNKTNESNFGLHIKATLQETDGFKDFGFNKSGAFTIKTGYKFNETSSIDILSMNGNHKNGQGWIGNTLEELNQNHSANGNISTETDNWFMSMNRLQYKSSFDNTVLVSSIYYQYQTGSYRMDLDNYMKRMIGEITDYGILYDYGLTHNMVGANTAIKHYLNNFNVSYGLNAYNYRRKHYNGNKGINVSPDEYYHNHGNKIDASVYTLLSYKILNDVTLSGNAQYRHVNFNYVDVKTPIMSFANPITWNFINYGFNLEYSPISNIKVYTKYNRVNREPTRSDMFGGNEYFTGEFSTTNHETSSDIEIGTEYKNNSVYANLNFYYMYFVNELVLNGEYGLNGLPCHDNADNSYRSGIETEISYNPIKNYFIRASASYSSNKITTETYGTKNHILTPKITFDSDLYYDNRKLNIGLNANYRSSMFIDMNNLYLIPYIFTLNAYGNYKFKTCDVGIRYNNITNKINYTNATIGANNQILYFRNAPSNINLYFKYNL